MDNTDFCMCRPGKAHAPQTGERQHVTNEQCAGKLSGALSSALSRRRWLCLKPTQRLLRCRSSTAVSMKLDNSTVVLFFVHLIDQILHSVDQWLPLLRCQHTSIDE